MTNIITYQREPWSQIRPELERIIPRHWEEIALNRDAIPLDPDYAQYNELDHNHKLVIVTARREGELIGYHVSIVTNHLHYRTTLFGFTDIYYLKPECRHGTIGIKLFREVERVMKELGVRKLTTSTKIHHDISPIFRFLGWSEVERVFTKLL